MSKNNQIKKSDKTFIRKEKARIRSQFLDKKKQEELINNLYKKILGQPEVKVAGEMTPKEEPKEVAVKKEVVKKEVKKEKKVKSNKK